MRPNSSRILVVLIHRLFDTFLIPFRDHCRGSGATTSWVVEAEGGLRAAATAAAAAKRGGCSRGSSAADVGGLVHCGSGFGRRGGFRAGFVFRSGFASRGERFTWGGEESRALPSAVPLLLIVGGETWKREARLRTAMNVIKIKSAGGDLKRPRPEEETVNACNAIELILKMRGKKSMTATESNGEGAAAEKGSEAPAEKKVPNYDAGERVKAVPRESYVLKSAQQSEINNHWKEACLQLRLKKARETKLENLRNEMIEKRNREMKEARREAEEEVRRKQQVRGSIPILVCYLMGLERPEKERERGGRERRCTDHHCSRAPFAA